MTTDQDRYGQRVVGYHRPTYSHVGMLVKTEQLVCRAIERRMQLRAALIARCAQRYSANVITAAGCVVTTEPPHPAHHSPLPSPPSPLRVMVQNHKWRAYWHGW